MHCAQKITENIYWIGSNDWTTERFENLFPIPNGVSYNSVPINSYEFLSVPKLQSGVNQLKINRLMIRNVKVDFVHKF